VLHCLLLSLMSCVLGQRGCKARQAASVAHDVPFPLNLLLVQGLGSSGLSPMADALVQCSPSHAQV
jgi:hypothetical protein